MNDTFTPNKTLTLQSVGGNNNTWGTVLNSTLTLIDTALGGTLTKSLSGNVTLNSTEAQNTGYKFTGTLSAIATVTFPAFFGFATVFNNTAGGFDIKVGISGLKAVVPNGEVATIWSDGTDFRRVSALFEGYTKTLTGDPTGATDNTTGWNALVSPGNSATTAALYVIPRGNWQSAGTVTGDDLTTWMLLPGSQLGFYDASKTGNTHATTTVDGLSANVITAGWQTGMTIRSSNSEIPAGTTITAIDPGGLSLTLSAAATGSNTGSTLSVMAGTFTASPNLQSSQFGSKQIGVGFMRSMSLAGTTTGGTDGRGAGTANQSTLLIQAVSQISNSVTSYRKRALFVSYDQDDASPQTANGTNASPTRDAVGVWSGVTSNVTPGKNGYGNTVHGRVFPVYARGAILQDGSAWTQVVTAELNNTSNLPTQKFPYQNGGPNFVLRAGSTVNAAGAGYLLNDILTLVGGTATTAAQIKITAVDPFLLQGSSTISNPGTGYAVSDVLTLAGGTSTSTAQITVTAVDAFTLQNSSTIGAAGTGYAANDILTLSGGTFTTAAQVKVLTVNGGGAVQTFSVQTAGAYSVKPSNPISTTGGTGTGFTLNAAWTNNGNVVSFTVSRAGAYSVKPTNPVSVTGGTGTGFALSATWLNTGSVVTFQVQNAGSYTVLPSNPVPVSGGAGTAFTLTATWQGQQASNHGVVVQNIGSTAGTSAVAVLANASTFWDGFMIDAAAVANNAFAVIATPGPNQNVLASIDNSGFIRGSGLICTLTSNTLASKIRSKNQGTSDATFLADVPSRTWQFGADQTADAFKIASAEGGAWNNTVLQLDSVGTIVLPGSGSFTANGTSAIALTNVAPLGASPTVQKWFTVSDGTRKYYIPAF